MDISDSYICPNKKFEQEKYIFLLIFLLKAKIATLNCEIMAKNLKCYIEQIPNLTAEKFGAQLPKGEELAGQTIRTIIKNAELQGESGRFTLSHERTRIFLNTFNKIADDEIKKNNNYTLKNQLSLDFYKYPGEAEIRKLIQDSPTKKLDSTKLMNIIINNHDNLVNEIYYKYKPKLISKYATITGFIIKKYEYYYKYSDDRFSNELISHSEDFNKVYLPENINEIYTELKKPTIEFINKHIRFFRLISSKNTLESFSTEILGIKKNSLIQYETQNPSYILSDSMIINIMEYFIEKEQPSKNNLFNWVFAELAHPHFEKSLSIQNKFSDLINDFTFLKYEQSINKKIKIRPESLDLLEAEIRYFVLQTYLNIEEDLSIKSLASFFEK